ncbi:MAG: tryptophan 7-halogenase [Myxococcales bacterium]|nr:tryptophan 7-halogenase [Myxococcales bacterium]
MATAFTMPVLRELFTNHELLHREAHQPTSVPDGVRSVGILGGGTAGWLMALALKTRVPWLEVTLIEAPDLPIIGVGEATVPSLVAFLHHYLELDVLDFTREVRPTWKQGIRFEWGQPGDYVFQAPFDWEVNGVGLLGAMAEEQNVSAFTLQGHLMAQGTTPILETNGELQSFLPILAFAYHLDNPSLVAFLEKTAAELEVRHLRAEVVEVETASVEGDDDPHVKRLVTRDGATIERDFYVDCSGFGSFLLEKALGARFESYASSLFTDRALAFQAPHHGRPMPYTTATTMDAGWCWTIPMRDSDHHGYVYASAHLSDDAALAELKKRWPEAEGERLVRFRSGRHDRAWIGNVFAVGNAYGFVEPLESTGLMMIQRAVTDLVRAFPIGPHSQAMRGFLNRSIGRDWDRLRWFLAAHFKFNAKLDTPFWRDCRAEVDVAGIEGALELYRALGPLSLLPRAMRNSVKDEVGVFFYGLHGLDTILLGQRVPHAPVAREPRERWIARRALAAEFASRGLPYAEALEAIEAHPEWLVQVVSHPSGWVAKMAEFI